MIHRQLKHQDFRGTKNLVAMACMGIMLSCNQPQAVNNKPGEENDSTSNAPTAAPGNPQEKLLYSRALNVVLWGMPAVNTELLYRGLKASNGDFNQVVYWSKLPSWKNQTLTPNPETVYLFPFYDTRNGPVVMEIPAAIGGSITGSLDDAWQTAIEDVGPAGVDKGRGGKYVILPPDFKARMPAGYIPMPSSTYTGFAILRSNIASGSDEDVAKAVAYGRQVKIYPLSAANAETRFSDALDVVYDNTIPYNFDFFVALNDFIQREPWLTRDMAMIDQLKTLGIEKGKPFSPDARTKEILNAAIRDAALHIDSQYEKLFTPPFFEGTHWALPASQELIKELTSNYADPANYPIDARGITYSMAYFSAKHLGEGQFYLMAISDKNGKPLDGSKTYRLTVPANPPVKLYWSATIYDRKTHALIRDMTRFSRASHSPGIVKNSDGSVDVYFGPAAPVGKDVNWIPTTPKGGFEVLFRFYGPEKALYDKTWKMGDIEEVSRN